MPAVAFKTGFFAVGFVGPLFFEMLCNVDLLEPLGHADRRFVADQTGGTVLRNIEVDFGEVIAVPFRGRCNLGIGRFRGSSRLGDMLSSRPVAVDAEDGSMFRLGPLLFDILVTLVANRVGNEHAGSRCDLLKGRCTIRAVAAHAIAIGFWHQSTTAFPCTYACQYKQCKQDPQMFGVRKKLHDAPVSLSRYLELKAALWASHASRAVAASFHNRQNRYSLPR